MPYNAHLFMDPLQVSRLPFIKGKVACLYEEGKTLYKGITFKTTKEDYDKASEKLLGKDTYQIKTGDKVFVMPGCNIPAFKLKDYIKSLGARIVGEIEDATVFIGCNNAIYSYSNYNYEKKPYHLMFLLSDGHCTKLDLIGSVINFEAYEEDDSFNQYKSENIIDNSGLYNFGITERSESNILVSTGKYNESEYFITPAAAKILYNCLLKKLPIINEKTLTEKCNTSIIITDEIYDSVVSMLESGMEDNISTAREIIANCDIKNSTYNIWRLSKKYYGTFSRSRFKNIRLFVEQSEFGMLNSLNNTDIIEHLSTKNQLTPEIFNSLINHIANVELGTFNNPLFNFNITLSERFKHFNPDFIKTKNSGSTIVNSELEEYEEELNEDEDEDYENEEI